MKPRIRSHRLATALAAVLVLSIGLGGTAAAVTLITGKQIKDGSVRGRDVGNGSLTGADVADRSLSPADFSGSVQGPAGQQGPAGPQGPKGDQGLPGAAGPQGAKGDKGATGDTGSPGPQGQAGPPGPQGLQGAAGVSGLQYVVSGAKVLPGYTYGNWWIACPDGKKAVAGGVSTSSTKVWAPQLSQSAPDLDGTKWYVTVLNEADSSITMYGWAVCAIA